MIAIVFNELTIFRRDRRSDLVRGELDQMRSYHMMVLEVIWQNYLAVVTDQFYAYGKWHSDGSNEHQTGDILPFQMNAHLWSVPPCEEALYPLSIVDVDVSQVDPGVQCSQEDDREKT